MSLVVGLVGKFNSKVQRGKCLEMGSCLVEFGLYEWASFNVFFNHLPFLS